MQELASIYEGRGVAPELAKEVARQMMAKDALGAHARDELGINEITAANPIQAAITSAITFAVGAALPLVCVLLSPAAKLTWITAIASLVFLAVLGALGARTGGASLVKGSWRVTFWGALAMAITYGVGLLFGTSVA